MESHENPSQTLAFAVEIKVRIQLHRALSLWMKRKYLARENILLCEVHDDCAPGGGCLG